MRGPRAVSKGGAANHHGYCLQDLNISFFSLPSLQVSYVLCTALHQVRKCWNLFISVFAEKHATFWLPLSAISHYNRIEAFPHLVCDGICPIFWSGRTSNDFQGSI